MKSPPCGGGITPIGLFSTKPLAMAAMHVAFEAFKTSMTEKEESRLGLGKFEPIAFTHREHDPWAAFRSSGDTDQSSVLSIRMGRGFFDEGGRYDDFFATFAINRVRLNRTVDKPSQAEAEMDADDLRHREHEGTSVFNEEELKALYKSGIYGSMGQS